MVLLRRSPTDTAAPHPALTRHLLPSGGGPLPGQKIPIQTIQTIQTVFYSLAPGRFQTVQTVQTVFSGAAANGYPHLSNLRPCPGLRIVVEMRLRAPSGASQEGVGR